MQHKVTLRRAKSPAKFQPLPWPGHRWCAAKQLYTHFQGVHTSAAVPQVDGPQRILRLCSFSDIKTYQNISKHRIAILGNLGQNMSKPNQMWLTWRRAVKCLSCEVHGASGTKVRATDLWPFGTPRRTGRVMWRNSFRLCLGRIHMSRYFLHLAFYWQACQ